MCPTYSSRSLDRSYYVKNINKGRIIRVFAHYWLPDARISVYKPFDALVLGMSDVTSAGNIIYLLS